MRRGSEPVLNKGDTVNCLGSSVGGQQPSGSVQAAIASINAGIYGGNDLINAQDYVNKSSEYIFYSKIANPP